MAKTTQLIEVKQTEQGAQAVSARELHKVLEVKKKFADWISILDNFDEGHDFLKSPKGYLKKSGKNTMRYYDDYVLTMDTAKEICMLSKTAKGRKMRRYFIKIEKKWNDPKEVMKRAGLALSPEKQQRLEIMKTNAATRQADRLLKIAKSMSDEQARNEVLAQAYNLITGKTLHYEIKEPYYTATEVGEKLGIHRSVVGRLATKFNMRPANKNEVNEWGRYYDVARPDGKIEQIFQYKQKAIDFLRKEATK